MLLSVNILLILLFLTLLRLGSKVIKAKEELRLTDLKEFLKPKEQ